MQNKSFYNRNKGNKPGKTSINTLERTKHRFSKKEPYEKHGTQLENKDGLIDHVIYVGRVVKVVKGGRRFSFSVLAVAGDGKGKVGIGLGKAVEMADAIRKAIEKSKTYLKPVALLENTIPHSVIGVFGASKVILKPAAEGVGLVASTAVRSILNSVGVKNVVSKCIGNRNEYNVTRATLAGLFKLRTIDCVEKRRGVSYE
ncbi:MAG: 30S ribosomal protein S5 [Deltaproteobacteria bacterium]|nr:MAG: 30S ribosomal protein S5 [Deltaproteobacteria bacterium]